MVFIEITFLFLCGTWLAQEFESCCSVLSLEQAAGSVLDSHLQGPLTDYCAGYLCFFSLSWVPQSVQSVITKPCRLDVQHTPETLSHISGGWRCQIRMPAWSGSGEGPPPSKPASFFVLHEKVGRDVCVHLLMALVSAQEFQPHYIIALWPPHLQIPSCWHGNILILGRHNPESLTLSQIECLVTALAVKDWATLWLMSLPQQRPRNEEVVERFD